MPHTDIREVREHYSTLRELVIQHPGGWDYAEARAKVRRLCGAGIAAIDDSDCHDKLRAVETIALEALNTRLFFIETQRSEAARAR